MRAYAKALKDYWFIWMATLGAAIVFKVWLAPLVTPPIVQAQADFYRIGTSAVAALVATIGFIWVWLAAKYERGNSK